MTAIATAWEVRHIVGRDRPVAQAILRYQAARSNRQNTSLISMYVNPNRATLAALERSDESVTGFRSSPKSANWWRACQIGHVALLMT